VKMQVQSLILLALVGCTPTSTVSPDDQFLIEKFAETRDLAGVLNEIKNNVALDAILTEKPGSKAFLAADEILRNSSLSFAAQDDKIVSLPGLNFATNYSQFSGYLKGDNTTYLHYWFVESQSSPRDSPLVVWMNGGPGCSSMDGLLNELGPFRVSVSMANGSLEVVENDFSWNTFANVLFLEAPACVGFSYSTESCDASDDSTSKRNYNALLDFLKKFPAMARNELYITGESYAGVYVPTLTKRIVEGEKRLNLKGFAVGNGITNYHKNDNSIIFFAYYHGLIGQRNWDALVDHCCVSDIPSRENCNFAASHSPQCDSNFQAAMNLIYNKGLNMYNLYADCVSPSSLFTAPEEGKIRLSRDQAEKRNFFQHSPWFTRKMNEKLSLDPPCTNSEAMHRFLNDPLTREAIHIPKDVQEWEVCSDEVNVNYIRQYMDMSIVYKALASHGVRGLVYNGDVDMACNYLGDQWFVEELGYPVTAERRMWKWAGQVGGFVKRFEKLDLLTVRGSGHMVPQDKPGPSLHMIKSFIRGSEY